MAFKRIQGKAANGSGTTLTVTWDATTGTNNLVVIGAELNSTARTVDTITDPGLNTYAKTTSSPLDNTVRIYQWFGVQTTGAASFLITQNTSGTIRAVADEFSGNATSSPFDKDSTGSGSGVSTFSVTSFTPTTPRSLIVCINAAGAAQTWTAGTNYTLGVASGTIVQSQFRLDSLGAETAPMTGSANATWLEIAGAYKELSADKPSRMMMGMGA